MRFGFVILIMLMPITASAEIYKWVDKNGNVHFGDKPGHREAVELNIKGAENKRTSDETVDENEFTREEKRKRILDAMNEDREERDKLKEDERIQQKNKKIQCAQLRDRMRRLKTATGLYNLDKNGNRVFLSHKDRGKSESRLKKAIDKNCR